MAELRPEVVKTWNRDQQYSPNRPLPKRFGTITAVECLGETQALKKEVPTFVVVGLVASDTRYGIAAGVRVSAKTKGYELWGFFY